MSDVPPPARPRFPVLLLMLVAFAAGAFADRRGWVPGRTNRQPARLDKTFAPFWEAWNAVDEHFVDREKVSPERMTQGAIRGMLDSLGDRRHTAYLTREQRADQKLRLSGQYEGIGAVMRLLGGQPTIVRVLPGSPARTAGLRAGDVVRQVNKKSVAKLKLHEVTASIKGATNTAVELRVLRPSLAKELVVTVQRGKVDRREVEWWMLPERGKAKPIVAHFVLASFSDKAAEQLRTAIGEARANGARGILLDLRGNSGGYKEQAILVASEFIEAGKVVLIQQDAKGRKEELKAKEGGLATDLPLCVLVDGATASSAEIVAGAIKGHQRGKIVGLKTVGAGTILRGYPLGDGGIVWLAVYKWLTPTGDEIWHKGIVPDVEVPLPQEAIVLLPDADAPLAPEAFAKSSDAQLRKAYEVLRKEIQ